MNQHLMVDLETLGTDPNSAVLSIGAVLFTQEALGESIYILPSLKEQVKKRVVDAGTICWWFDQGAEAKKVFQWANASTLTIAGTVSDFVCFIDKHALDKKNLKVWSNGAGFDVPIMEHMIKSTGIEVPWKFWNIKCYRTLKSMHPEFEKGIFCNTKHHALEDAKFQASCLQRFFKNNPQLDR